MPESSTVESFESEILYWESGKATALAAGRGGTDTIGVPSASNEICFAEGCTSYSFEEWLCLMNPNPATAHATLTYMTSDGTKTSDISINPNSRTTVDVDQALQPHTGDVSVKISSDYPIMAERAMYWGRYFEEPWYYDHIKEEMVYKSAWESRVGGHASIGYSQ